jgi:hypothetical protein
MTFPAALPLLTPIRRRFSTGRVALAVLLSLVMVVTGDVWIAERASAGTPVRTATATPSCPQQAADEASAQATARLCGGPVGIASLQNETDAATANADGSVTWEHRYRPVRVRRDDGWVPADATLMVRPDGTVGPRASAVDVVFSGGGAGPLATVSNAGGSVSWGSPVGDLPAPTLAGSIATYADVLPGVDLRLKADVDGFAEVLVVKNATAAANPALARLSFPVSGNGLSVAADAAGNLRVVDGTGAQVFQGNAPLMWNGKAQAALQDPAQADAQASMSGSDTPRQVVLPATASVSNVQVTPDASLLTSSTSYPVYIDPGVTAYRSAWALVDSGAPSTSYWNSSGDALAGTWNSGTNKLRSFFNLNVAATPIAGKYIVAAHFWLNNTYSPTCSPREVQLWSTTVATSTTTWNNQPTWSTQQDAKTESHGFDTTCPDAGIMLDATPNAQAAATGGWSNMTLGVRAASETDTSYWKHLDNNPTLTITYTAYPTIGTRSLTPASSTACATGSTRPYVRSTTPTFTAQVNDPEGASVRPEFEWDTLAGTVVGSAQPTPGQPSGSSFSTTVPTTAPLTDGATYKWRARGYDSTAWGPWSSWCEFTVDATPPGTPFVNSTDYPQGTPSSKSSGVFTFAKATADSDVVGFKYQLDTDTTTKEVAADASGAASVTVSSPTDGHRTMTVWAKDKAGTFSPTSATWAFQVGRAAIATPRDGAQVAAKTTLSLDIPDTTLTRVRYLYRRGPGAAERDLPWSNLTTASGGAISAANGSPVAISSLGGSATWNVADTLGSAGGVVQVRALLLTNSDTDPAYYTQYVTLTLDPDSTGAASSQVGPGSVNLLTGDYTLSTSDVNELGMSVDRVASSRRPGDGWLPQGERLTVNEQQISTDLTGFWAANTTLTRDTGSGQGGSTDSIKIAPLASGGTASGPQGDTFAAVGGDDGALRLGMQAGKRYRATGWIYVPAATGLNPAGTAPPVGSASTCSPRSPPPTPRPPRPRPPSPTAGSSCRSTSPSPPAPARPSSASTTGPRSAAPARSCTGTTCRSRSSLLRSDRPGAAGSPTPPRRTTTQS